MISNYWLDAAMNAKKRDARRGVIAELCMVDEDRRKEREANLKRQAENLARKQRAEEAQIRLAGQMQEELDLLKNQLDELKCSNVELRAANEQMAVANRELETANGQLKVAKQDSDREAKSAKRRSVIALVVSIIVAVVGWNESWKQYIVEKLDVIVRTVGLKG